MSKLAIYHANAKCTGAAVKFNPHPATDDKDGGIAFTFANQKTVGDRHAATPTYPTFDFENGITVDLGFEDISLMLQVFRGYTESIRDGRGIYKSGDGKRQVIRLSHQLEPFCGYAFEVTEATDAENLGEKKSHIFFAPHEALGLQEVLAYSLLPLAFGLARL